MTTATMEAKLEKLVNMSDCTRCYASKARGTMIDTIHPATGLSWCYSKSLAQVREEYPDAEEMTVDAFSEWKAAQQRTPITWAPTTEERFTEMLEVLPPALWLRNGFLIGEPWDHDAGNGQPRYEAYRQRSGAYLVGSRPMTRAEFRAELATA